MATTLEELQVLITANTRDLQRQLGEVRTQLGNTERATTRITQRLSSGFSGISKAVMGTVAVFGATIGAITMVGRAVAGASKNCLELGSDLQEVQNVVDVTFGSMSDKVNEFARSAIESYGLSETVAKKYIGTFGAMNKAFGFSTEKSYEMAEAVTRLTGDVASFYNLSSDEAYTKLKSIWTGETESLKDLGVVMTQTALDQYALANGYGKTVAKMSEAEKVMLRYAFVQDRLSAASGDFERTSGGWANQVRVLGLRFESLQASIGQGLIPILTPIIQGLNNLIGKLQVAVEWFNKLVARFTGQENVSEVTTAATGATAAVEGIGEGAEESADDTVKAVKKIKGALAGIDEINVLKSNDDSGVDDTSAGSSDSGVGEIISKDSIKETGTALDDMMKKIEDFIKKVKAIWEELRNEFQKGFKVGLGDGDVKADDLLSICDSLKNGIKGIFGDGSVFEAYKEFIRKMMYGLGEMAGAFTSIGNTIAINLLGGMAKYLEQNSDFIKDRYISIYSNWGDIFVQMGDFAAAVADVFSVFRGEVGQQITADIISVFANSALGITDLISRLGNDILRLMTQPFVDNKDAIKSALESTLPIVQKVTGTIAEYVKHTWETIFKTYDEYVKPAFENFTQGLSTITTMLIDSYNKYVKPTFDKVADLIVDTYDKHIQPTTDKFFTVMGKLALRVSEIFEQYIAPIIVWFADNVLVLLMSQFENLMVVAETVTGVIYDTFGVMLDGLEYLIDGKLGELIATIQGWIEEKWNNIWNGFAKSWEDGWKAVVDTFDSIFGGIVSVAKQVINALIDKINGFKIEIPVALKTVLKDSGINVPTSMGFNIPKLAKGGIINNPTLAMIGEAGREAVVPLQNNTQGLDMLADLISDRIGGSREQPVNIELTLNIGGERIASSLVKQINTMSRARGRSVIDII